MTTSTLKDYENLIEEYEDNIKKIPAMTLAAMQEEFGTDDTKEEFIAILQEEINFMKKAIEEEIEEDAPIQWIDEGFANEADYNQYIFG